MGETMPIPESTSAWFFLSPAAEIYVAPSGSDANDGSAPDKP